MPIITDQEALEKQCKALSNEEYITVDTEFLRDKFYYPKLCLIQIASKETAFAVDPLVSDINLDPVFKLLSNKKIVKVFHSARQDIEIIFNLSGTIPEPVFDTQVAAMVCGYGASASYATLVSEITGHHVDKSSRFTDWSRRPLSNKQIDYAISDVTHLRDVYESLKKELEENKRESWLAEEMQTLTSKENYTVDPDKAWERLKPKGMSRRFLGILRELAKWRELTAQKSNKPKTHIIKDPALLEIAAVAPESKEQLRSIRAIGSIKKDFESEIIAAIQYAKELPEIELPEKRKTIKRSNSNEALTDLLKIILKAKCEEMHVAEKLVASADDIKKIANNDPDAPVFSGWRKKIFGQYVEQLKNGKLALSLKNGKIELIDTPTK